MSMGTPGEEMFVALRFDANVQVGHRLSLAWAPIGRKEKIKSRRTRFSGTAVMG